MLLLYVVQPEYSCKKESFTRSADSTQTKDALSVSFNTTLLPYLLINTCDNNTNASFDFTCGKIRSQAHYQRRASRWDNAILAGTHDGREVQEVH